MKELKFSVIFSFVALICFILGILVGEINSKVNETKVNEMVENFTLLIESTSYQNTKNNETFNSYWFNVLLLQASEDDDHRNLTRQILVTDLKRRRESVKNHCAESIGNLAKKKCDEVLSEADLYIEKYGELIN